MSNKTKKIAIVIAILVVVIIVGILFLTGIFNGKNAKIRDIEVEKYVTLECKLCHDGLDSTRQNGFHNKVACQDCHGLGDKHSSYPLGNKMIKPGQREDCGECHSFDGQRKEKTTKHIDLKKHNIKDVCINCHNPHSAGLMFGGSEINNGDSRVCQMCHGNILKVIGKGEHRSVACQECHGASDQHLKGPAKGNIMKPTERSQCGKCHANSSKGKIKQIDIKDHNTDMKCVECHIAHNPLEFK